jgi:hypothetical protein
VEIELAGCNFQKQADAKFGDQHFKTAISLVELHKIRSGVYPESLKDLKFTGDWDALALSSVEYKKLDIGYELLISQKFGRHFINVLRVCASSFCRPTF